MSLITTAYLVTS